MGKLRCVEVVDCSRFTAELTLLPSYLSKTRANSMNYHRHTQSVDLSTWAPIAGHDRDWFAAFHSQKSLAVEAKHFISIVTWMHGFAERHKGWLGRAQIVVLEPQKEVYPHEDWGLYYALRDRYHLVLESNGSVMMAGKEEVTFKTGDAFFYPNKVRHGARNNSDSPRTHLIFDLLPKNVWRQFARFLWYLLILKRHQRSLERFPATYSQDVEHFAMALREQHFYPLSHTRQKPVQYPSLVGMKL